MHSIQFKKLLKVVTIGLGISLIPQIAMAKKVYSPIVKQGEMELETQNEIFRSKNPANNRKSKYQLELSYGFTDRWHSGLYTVYEKNPGSALKYTQSKWANIVQLLDSEKYWLDIGLYAEYIWYAPSLKKADLLELKILLEKPVNQWKHTLNMVIKQPLWGKTNATSLGYAWRSRYKMSSGLEPAIEAYGPLGTTSKFQLLNQTHLIGPALEFELIDGLEVNFAWLMSTTEGPAYGDFKFNIEYEF